MGAHFSERHGYGRNRAITVREDAPEGLRAGLIQIDRDLGLDYHDLREVTCAVLHRFPDPNNWTEIPNVHDEVIGLVLGCDWYRVYDFAEALHRRLAERQQQDEFAARLNRLFEGRGSGGNFSTARLLRAVKKNSNTPSSLQSRGSKRQ